MSIKYCITAGHPEDKPCDELKQQFAEIEQAFLLEPSLLPVTAENLAASFGAGYAVLALDTIGGPVGYTRLQHLPADDHPIGPWFELGSTWVHPDFRGRKINETMYSILLPRHKDRNILATTTNPISYQVGKQQGFVHVPRRALPEEVWKSSCVCPLAKTRSSSPDNSGCRYAHGEAQQSGSLCWFRVTLETAVRNGLLKAPAIAA